MDEIVAERIPVEFQATLVRHDPPSTFPHFQIGRIPLDDASVDVAITRGGSSLLFFVSRGDECHQYVASTTDFFAAFGRIDASQLKGRAQTMTITHPQLITSLRSEICPACGDLKKRRQTLCRPCYRRLPPKLRADLYDPLGGGYEEAVTAAMAALRATEFKLAASDGSRRHAG
jgi:hypothetical protein